MWISKNGLYENPLILKGDYKFTGSNQRPKDICKDNDNGTRKA